MPGGKPFFRFEPLWWLDADTRAIEAFAALVAAIFAIVLLAPGDLFAERSGYRAMGELLAEWKWGLIFLFQWLLQSMAMCGNVRLLRYPSAFFAMILWAFVGTCFWLAGPATLAPYLFFLIAAFMAWVIRKGPTDGAT